MVAHFWSGHMLTRLELIAGLDTGDFLQTSLKSKSNFKAWWRQYAENQHSLFGIRWGGGEEDDNYLQTQLCPNKDNTWLRLLAEPNKAIKQIWLPSTPILALSMLPYFSKRSRGAAFHNMHQWGTPTHTYLCEHHVPLKGILIFPLHCACTYLAIIKNDKKQHLKGHFLPAIKGTTSYKAPLKIMHLV